MLIYLFYKTFSSVIYPWKGFLYNYISNKMSNVYVHHRSWFLVMKPLYKEAPLYQACDCVTGSKLLHTVTLFKCLIHCALKKFKTSYFSIYMGTNSSHRVNDKFGLWPKSFMDCFIWNILFQNCLPENINITLWARLSIISALLCFNPLVRN